MNKKLKQKYMNEYIRLFDELKEKLGSRQSAYELLREIHYEFMVAMIHYESFDAGRCAACIM